MATLDLMKKLVDQLLVAEKEYAVLKGELIIAESMKGTILEDIKSSLSKAMTKGDKEPTDAALTREARCSAKYIEAIKAEGTLTKKVFDKGAEVSHLQRQLEIAKLEFGVE